MAGQGCYLDNPNNPDLPHEQREPVPNPDVPGPLPTKARELPVFSPDACVQNCKAKGFTYAATKVEFKSEIKEKNRIFFNLSLQHSCF